MICFRGCIWPDIYKLGSSFVNRFGPSGNLVQQQHIPVEDQETVEEQISASLDEPAAYNLI
jgi:hypothetical protein